MQESINIVFENRSDEPFRTFKDNCCGTIRTIESGGDKRVLEIRQIESRIIQKCGDRDKDGNYTVHNYSNTIPSNAMSDRGQMVVEIGTTHWPHGWLKENADFSGTCPTINAKIHQQHTLLVEKQTVEVKQATKEGVIPCKIGGVADLNYPNSKTRRGRVQGDGEICPTLTTENIPSVLEPWIWEIDGVSYLIRIRKLTPRECWRLMDFTDTDYKKAESVNSNTQLYKQAGNSIVKNVLCEVFKQLL